MKKVHLYIEAGSNLDETANFYKVGVGTSQQANSDYLFLTAYAVEHSHYFESWSDNVSDFLEKIAKSLAKHPYMFITDVLTIKKVDARDLVRHFKTSESIQVSSNVLANQHLFRQTFNVNYRITSNFKK